MKRLLITSLVLASVVTVVPIVANSSENPYVTFGPHKTGMKFVPYDEAHAIPLFDFKFPIIGRITYPNRKPMEGVDATDDPRFIVGYVVVDSPAAWENSQDTYWMLPGHGAGPEPKPVILPVSFPRSKAESKTWLQIFPASASSVPAKPERVEVKCRFDPTKLPARYKEVITNVGDLKLQTRVDGVVRGTTAMVTVRCSSPQKSGAVQFETSNGRGSGSMTTTSSFPMDFQVDGTISKAGEVVILANVSYGLGDNPLGKPETVRIVITPAPPKAVKRT